MNLEFKKKLITGLKVRKTWRGQEKIPWLSKGRRTYKTTFSRLRFVFGKKVYQGCWIRTIKPSSADSTRPHRPRQLAARGPKSCCCLLMRGVNFLKPLDSTLADGKTQWPLALCLETLLLSKELYGNNIASQHRSDEPVISKTRVAWSLPWYETWNAAACSPPVASRWPPTNKNGRSQADRLLGPV